MTNQTDDEINKVLEDELDKQFPKGDKARGRALVLFAIAQMEIKKAQDEILDEFDILIGGVCKDVSFHEMWIIDRIRTELRKRKEKLELVGK